MSAHTPTELTITTPTSNQDVTKIMSESEKRLAARLHDLCTQNERYLSFTSVLYLAQAYLCVMASPPPGRTVVIHTTARRKKKTDAAAAGDDADTDVAVWKRVSYTLTLDSNMNVTSVQAQKEKKLQSTPPHTFTHIETNLATHKRIVTDVVLNRIVGKPTESDFNLSSSVSLFDVMLGIPGMHPFSIISMLWEDKQSMDKDTSVTCTNCWGGSMDVRQLRFLG